MKNISQKTKKTTPTLSEVMIKAIEHWHQYGLINESEYKVQMEEWGCITKK